MSKRNAIFQPLVVALLVAIGFGLAWGVVAGWCVTIADQFARSGTIYRDLFVRIDGIPAVRTQLSSVYGDWSVQTLDGEPLEGPRAAWALAGAIVHRHGAHHPFLDAFRNPGWRERIYSFLDGGRPPVFWYFVSDGQTDGRGYFVGYDSRAKSLVGYIGEQGFQREKPAPEACFPIDGRLLSYTPQLIASAGYSRGGAAPDMYSSGYTEPPPGQIADWMLYVVSADRLVEVNLRERTVRVIFEQEGLISADMLRKASPEANEEEFRNRATTPYVAACTVDRVFLLDNEGKLKSTFRIPEGLHARSITAYLVGDDTMLYVITKYGEGARRYELTWANRQGDVLKQREVSYPMHGFPESKPAEAFVLGLVVPAPLVAAGGYTLVDPLTKVAMSGTSYSDALARSLSAAWPTFVALLIVAIVLAWRTWRRQREFGAARTWVWVGFVILFGVPGYFGYLFHRGWPARKPCSSCGENAPRDRSACFACGTEFPPPAEQGIEVFA